MFPPMFMIPKGVGPVTASDASRICYGSGQVVMGVAKDSINTIHAVKAGYAKSCFTTTIATKLPITAIQ